MPISRRDLCLTSASALLTATPAGAALAAPSPRGGGDLAALRRGVQGRLILPGDADYAAATRGHGPTPVDGKHPTVIVLPSSAQDVAAAVLYARAAGLQLAVRSGGHDNLGLSTTQDGVQIDLSTLDAVSVDPQARTARVGAGALCRKVNGAGAPYDLVPAFGYSGTIGVSGITLGGGLSRLAGTVGAACDNVLSAQIVTPDGKVRTVSPRENPDLFWAIRGGGGNFGVVTELTYRLHHVPTVLAGTVLFETDFREFLPFYQDFIDRSPDALDTSVTIAFGPPATRVSLNLCWSGDLAEGERVMQPIRRYGKVVRDSVAPQKFVDYQGGDMTRPNTPPSDMLWRGGQLARVDARLIATLSDIEAAGPPPGCSIGLLHYMHGKLCDIDPASSAYLRDRGHILYNVITYPTGEEAERKRAWLETAYGAMSRIANKKAYINYLSSNREDDVRAAYGANYARLQGLKRLYDPDNLMRNNRNIRPR